MQEGGKLILTDCSKNKEGVITGAECNYGLVCLNRGEISMYGGIVTDNKPYSDNFALTAGGSYICNGGTFTMYDGVISGCKAYAGGVYVLGDADDGTSFTMYGGKVTGNAGYYGGGVYMSAGEMTFADTSSIKDNTATNRGGDSYCHSCHGKRI